MYDISLEQVSFTRIGNGIYGTSGSTARINGNRRTTRLVFLSDQLTHTVINQNVQVTDHTLIDCPGNEIHLFFTLYFHPNGSGQTFLHAHSLHTLFFRLARTAYSRHC